MYLLYELFNLSWRYSNVFQCFYRVFVYGSPYTLWWQKKGWFSTWQFEFFVFVSCICLVYLNSGGGEYVMTISALYCMTHGCGKGRGGWLSLWALSTHRKYGVRSVGHVHGVVVRRTPWIGKRAQDSSLILYLLCLYIVLYGSFLSPTSFLQKCPPFINYCF